MARRKTSKIQQSVALTPQQLKAHMGCPANGTLGWYTPSGRGTNKSFSFTQYSAGGTTNRRRGRQAGAI